MPRPIHLFEPKFRVEECVAGIRECLERGWTGMGWKTLEFETAWEKFTGLPKAHFVNSATAGLHLAIRALRLEGDWAEGDEVATTPLTFVSTNHAIVYEGLRPLFIDVDEHLCMDPGSLEDRISTRTRAVLFVGLGGNWGALDRIAQICKAKSLALILDAAHMAGTRKGDRHAGVGCDAAVFSFQAVKNLPTADSGMVSMGRPGLDRHIRTMSWLGIDRDTYSRTVSPPKGQRWRYSVKEIGFKYNGNSVMAAIGLAQLPHLEEENVRRRSIAALYDEELAGLDPAVERVPMAQGCVPSRHLYQVLADARDDLVLHLYGKEIYPGVHYESNTDHPVYAYAKGSCPYADASSARLLSLPLHLGLTDGDAMRVADAIRDFYGRRRG